MPDDLGEAIARRDLEGALDCVAKGWRGPFVWPDTYERVYKCQLVSAREGFPIAMRGAWAVMADRRGSGGHRKLAIEMFERWLRLYKVTEVERPLADLFREMWPDLARRAGADWGRDPWDYTLTLKDMIAVKGRKVPTDRERIKELERAIKLVEKLDKLAA